MTQPAKDFRLNRIFSTPLTAILLKTPLTPNHVTFLSLSFGILAGLFFSQGAYTPSLLGALSYQLACVLDNCDGEIARAKKMGSGFGAWLDIAADFLTDLSLFLGIGLGVLKHAPDHGWAVVFIALCLSGAFIHVVLVVLEKIRGFGPAAFGVPNPDQEARKNMFSNIFDALREGDASWLVVLLALAGKADLLLWFGGIYMQILWLAALFLNFRFLFPKK
jgi:phosphatidylglycerophosphate synthase